MKEKAWYVIQLLTGLISSLHIAFQEEPRSEANCRPHRLAQAITGPFCELVASCRRSPPPTIKLYEIIPDFDGDGGGNSSDICSSSSLLFGTTSLEMYVQL